MRGGELMREARRRAGMTQARVAALLGTGQSTIVRWESGQRSPSFETVTRTVRDCGLELRVSLGPSNSSALGDARAMSLLSPEQKLDANRNLVALKGLAKAPIGG